MKFTTRVGTRVMIGWATPFRLAALETPATVLPAVTTVRRSFFKATHLPG